MPNPHTYSGSHRANVVLAAIEQARMVPAMGSPSPRVHNTALDGSPGAVAPKI